MVIPMLGALTLWLLVPFSQPSIPAWGLELTGGLGVWVIGNSVASLRTLAFSLEERALRIERERELSTQLALAGERARISRELHDIVAHSVSVISVQANAARKLLRKDPDSAAEAPVSVEGSAREALSELRSMLGLLGDGKDVELGPQPGIGELGGLVERVGAAGLPVRLGVNGRPRPLPPGLDLAAYRFVQEALTNSLRYTHGADTSVSVAYDEAELRLAIVNEPGGAAAGPAGSGRGLLGLKERVSIYGRQVEAGRRPEGRFRGAGQVASAARLMSEARNLRIVIADDQALVRTGFRMILNDEADMQVVADVGDGDAAVAAVRRTRPDIVLMDIRMPVMDGLEATRRILEGGSSSRVIILTTFDVDEYVYSALRAGASGFLLKDVSHEQLVGSVRMLAAGDALLAPSITRRLIERFVTPPGQAAAPAPALSSLTDREREVFTRILSKLGVRDRVQAVVLAHESGLVAPGV